MVSVLFTDSFRKQLSKIKNPLREKILKQIVKVSQRPFAGKPMRFARKETRELYIAPFRLSYEYDEAQQVVLILSLYHKDGQ